MIYSILIGLVIGFVAKFLMPGRDPQGFIITALIGIGGATLAYWIGSATGMYEPGEGAGFIASVLGAMVLLLGYRMVAGRAIA